MAQPKRDHSWDTQYLALIQFQEREGHCNVPAHGRTTRRLGSWLNKQRTLYKKGRLAPHRLARLASLGVVWDVLTTQWELGFADLVKFKAETGHCRVPRRYPPNPRLATWLSVQRREHHLGTLSADRTARLEALGAEWTPQSAAWERRVQSLVEYAKAHGNCDVPREYPDNPALSTWVFHQRAAKRRGQLSAERAARLDSLGFRWDPREDSERSVMDTLAIFHARHGHCNVSETDPHLGAVGQWLTSQRMARRQGRLSKERIAKLESLGISWKPHEDAWNERYEALCQFHTINGHCDAPRAYRPDIGLAGWVTKQRSDQKRGKILPQRKARLDSLGFVWDPSRRSEPSKHRRQNGKRLPSWDSFAEQLLAFKLKVGHCDVPARFPENLALGRWLARQREKWRRGTLDAEKTSLLESAGVVWDPALALEERRYASIAAYQQAHGHGNIPETHPELGAVGAWLTSKRMAKRRGTLRANESRRLKSLGVDWDPHEVAWQQQFDALRNFMRVRGHCEIPRNSPEYQSLGSWASTQRNHKRLGKLKPERLALLQSIGFTWDPAEQQLESMFGALQDFVRNEGHSDVPHDCDAYPGLGAWLSAQRSAKKRGALNPEIIERLSAMGISWNPRWEGKVQIQGYEGKCCQQCSEPFAPSHGNARYCSAACYMRASKEEDRNTGCRVWTKGLDSKGRPHAHWGRRRRKAHIFAFELAGGELLRGTVLRHVCNNPRCCNPDHLLVGTHAENMRDKAVSGISAGERNYNAAVSDAVACDIFRARGKGSTAEIAARFGVSLKVVLSIWNGHSYARATGASLQRKGRPRGQDNHSSRCSNETALLVYAEKAAGMPSAAAAARKHAVSESIARNIWSGRSFTDITGASNTRRPRARKSNKCNVCRKEVRGAAGHRKYCSWECCLSAHIRVGDADKCWPWAKERPAGGYGQLQLGGTRAMAHIVAFDLAYPILAIMRKADMLTVSHLCHNTLCCNPRHLSLATAQENSSANRGRPDLSGASNKQTKTPVRVVKAIKQMIAGGLENKEIISRIKANHGASISTMLVSDIRRGRAWRTVHSG